MNINICAYRFLQIFKEIAEVDLQIKLWLNIENHTNQISSFSDLMDNIDTGELQLIVDNFIADSSCKADIAKLLKLIENYKAPEIYYSYQNDAYIIADPKWKRIRDFAKEITIKYNNTFHEIQNLIDNPDDGQDVNIMGQFNLLIQSLDNLRKDFDTQKELFPEFVDYFDAIMTDFDDSFRTLPNILEKYDIPKTTIISILHCYNLMSFNMELEDKKTDDSFRDDETWNTVRAYANKAYVELMNINISRF